MDRFLLQLARAVFLVLGLSACQPAPTGAPSPTSSGPSVATPPAQPARPALSGELVVFAAASLSEAFTEIGQRLEASAPGLRVTFNFAGSPQLRTQIEQGARADLFASANIEQMELAVRNGVISGTPRLFASNKLVVVVPRENPGRIQSVGDLARPGLKLVLAQRDVPAGAYAREIFQKLSADPAYGAVFADGTLRNVVSEEPNVRQVLAKVQLGEADAAIVYATDVTAQTANIVQVLPIPDQFNVVALYPIAVVQGARNREAAEAFINAVLASEGQATLKKYGFLPPP
ncbi:MAG: molybdate ABC transporter substrate-binding protein [Chloroflexi bacterium]|nr:molybdate ABC transporter substrate-binding protein [Chloroflexota bacterium]